AAHRSPISPLRGRAMQGNRVAGGSFAWVKFGLVVFVIAPLLGIFTLTAPESTAQDKAKPKDKAKVKDKDKIKDKAKIKDKGKPKRFCSTHELHMQMKKTNAAYRAAREKIQKSTASFVGVRLASARAAVRTSVIIIPVVVHVVYNTPAQNISDAQINNE